MSTPDNVSSDDENGAHAHRPNVSQSPGGEQTPKVTVVPRLVGASVPMADAALRNVGLNGTYSYDQTALDSQTNPQTGEVTFAPPPGVHTPQGQVPFVLANPADPNNADAAPTIVTAQNPAAGTTAFPGATVQVAWRELPKNGSSKGPLIIVGVIAAALLAIIGGVLLFGNKSSNTITVPSVINMSVPEATTKIVDTKLVLGQVTNVPNKAPKGTIVAQTPVAGTMVAVNTAVNVSVSTGTTMLTVPNVVGDTTAAAKKTLTDAGLTVGAEISKESDEPAGTVLSQTPVAGLNVPSGTKVNLTVSDNMNDVPAVLGMTEKEAAQALVKAGFVVKTTSVESSTAKSGTVVAQTPDPGSPLARGKTVTIAIAVAPPSPKPTPTVTVSPTATPTVKPSPTGTP